MKRHSIIGLSIVALIIIGSCLIVNYQAYAIGCYDKFIFNWFSLNDVLLCLDNSSGSGVTSLTSTNDAITLNATNGNISITPAYQLLCRQELGSASSSITCSSLPIKDFIVIKTYIRVVNTMEVGIRFNNDGNNNYASRIEYNGGVDSNIINTNRCRHDGNTLGASGLVFTTWDISNSLDTDRKLAIGHAMYIDNTGAGTAPTSRADIYCKWANTSAQITRIDLVDMTGNTNRFNTGSILEVWGYD